MVPTKAEIMAAARAVRDTLGSCHGGPSMAECVYMVTDGNCVCTDIARAALEAAERVRPAQPFIGKSGYEYVRSKRTIREPYHRETRPPKKIPLTFQRLSYLGSLGEKR